MIKIFIILFFISFNLYSFEYIHDGYKNYKSLNNIEFSKKIGDELFNKIKEKDFIIIMGKFNNVLNFLAKYKIPLENPKLFVIFNNKININIINNLNYITSRGLNFVFLKQLSHKEEIILTDNFFITNNKVFYKENNLIFYDNIKNELKNYYFNKWRNK